MKLVDTSDSAIVYVTLGLLYFSVNVYLLYIFFNSYSETLSNIMLVFVSSQAVSIILVLIVRKWVRVVIHVLEMISRMLIYSQASQKTALITLIKAYFSRDDSTYPEVLSVGLEENEKDRASDKLVTEFITPEKHGFIKIDAAEQSLNTTGGSSLTCKVCTGDHIAEVSIPIYDYYSDTSAMYYTVCETFEEKLLNEAGKQMSSDIRKQLVAKNI